MIKRISWMIYLFIVLTLFACQMGPSVKRSQDVVAIGPEQYHQGAGVEQYFLPDLPTWANFSMTGQCIRSINVRFLNFTKLHQTFELNYEQLIQLQLMVNLEMQKFKRETNSSFLMPRDEEIIFQQCLAKIQGGVKIFIPHQFSPLNLLWIDGPKNDQMNFFSKLKQRQVLDLAPPVLMSTCLGRNELEQIVNEQQLQEFSPTIISAEMFSPYDLNYQLSASFAIYMEQLLPKKQLKFYSVTGNVANEFQGKITNTKL